MKLVELTREVGPKSVDVVAAVGPMRDPDADDYATRLGHLVEQRHEPGLSVRTTPVESTSGEAAEPPADPAQLLHAVLSGRSGGESGGEHELPG